MTDVSGRVLLALLRNVARIKNKIQKHNYDVVPLKSALINNEPIDLAAAIGGDGTFIRAAGWIRGNNSIPLVGFNSDPEGSHGELCSILPSQAEDFFTRLHDNRLRYLLRTRIRTQLRGPAGSFKPMNTMVAHKVAAIPENSEMESRILNEKALNEVFVGEIDSTAPSYFEISVNGGKPQKIKCSGLLVSTGTGSTGCFLEFILFAPFCPDHFTQARFQIDVSSSASDWRISTY